LRALTLVLLFVPSAARQRAPADEKGDNDTDFILTALAAESAITRASELAQAQAPSQAFKDFARKVPYKNGAFLRDLMTLARGNKLAAETAGVQGQRQANAALADCEGAAFERAYLKYTLQNRQQIADLCARYAAGSASEAVRDQARVMLPVLRQQ